MENNEHLSSNAQKKLHPLVFVQIIVNIVLIAAVLVLFLLWFSKEEQPIRSSSSANLSIAFVNSDTLMKKYQLFQDLKSELEAETKMLQEDLEKRHRDLESRILSYQKKTQTGNISIDEARRTEEQLARLQQELIKLNDQYTQQIAQKELEMTHRILDSVIIAIKLFNQAEHYDFVLGYSKGAGILFANPSFDVTEEIVAILNNRYKRTAK